MTEEPASETTGPAAAHAALEVVKTTAVWLVVANVLTSLAPLVPLPFKWALAAHAALTLAVAALGYLTFSRARRAQRLIAGRDDA